MRYGGSVISACLFVCPVLACCAVCCPEPDAALIFHADFNGSAVAVKAGGNASPIECEGLEFLPGHSGQAVRISQRAASRLSYEVPGNLNPTNGTIAFWFRGEWPEEKPGWRGEGRPTKDEIWRSIVFAPSDVRKPGDGSLNFWMWGPSGRFDRNDLDNHLDGGKIPYSPDWQYVVICWDDFGTRVYVDEGRMRVSDAYSPMRRALQKPKTYAFDRDTKAFKRFFIGCGGPNCNQLDGVIDDFKVWSRAMSEREVEKLFEQVRDVEIVTDRSFVLSGRNSQISIAVRSPSGRNLDGARVLLQDAARREVWTSRPLTSLGGSVVADVNLVRGSYCFRVRVGDQLYGNEGLGVLGGDNPAVLPIDGREPGSGVPSGMRLVQTICPDPRKLGGEAFRSIGRWSIGELGGRRYLEAGDRAGDRFAIRVRLSKDVPLYCMEIDYPDNTNRTADLIIQRSRHPGGDYAFQVGYYCGGEVPNSGKVQTHRCLYWNRDDDITLVVMTAKKGSPAAVSDIRVYEIREGALPDAAVKEAPAVGGRFRHFGSYWEDPAVGFDFAASAETLEGFETIVNRLAAMLRFTGRDVLVYPGCWYHGLIDKAYQPRQHPYRFLQAYYEKFAAQGLSVIPTVNLQTVPFDESRVTVKTMRNGSLHDTAIAIHDTGMPSWGGWHGKPPNFCIFHRDVQDAIERIVDTLVREGVSYPSFKGVCFHLTSITCPWWGSIQSGYNDYVITAFERDTGVTVPVDRADPERGRLYAEWLKANAAKKWVRWRCDFLTGFYSRLARKLVAARPDLELYINAMPQADAKDPAFMDAGYRDRILREAGIDPEGLAREIPNLVMGTVAYPSRWRHYGYGGKFRDSAHAERCRLYNADEGYYTIFRSASYPWLNLHDDYWESPIGSGNGSASLSGEWLKECGWRVSCLNASGRHAMRMYALALKFGDILAFSRGGYLIGSYGMEREMVEFARAFRRLPAVKFDDAESSNPDVVYRTKKVGDVWYGYVVNVSDRRQEAKVVLPCTDRQKVFRLEPWQLKSFVRQNEASQSGKL